MYVYMYICIYQWLGVLVQPGNRFVSFVRRVRYEAACARGDGVASDAGPRKLPKCAAGCRGFCPSPVCCLLV